MRFSCTANKCVSPEIAGGHGKLGPKQGDYVLAFALR